VSEISTLVTKAVIHNYELMVLPKEILVRPVVEIALSILESNSSSQEIKLTALNKFVAAFKQTNSSKSITSNPSNRDNKLKNYIKYIIQGFGKGILKNLSKSYPQY
jgi:hypothetical protein